MGSIDQDFSCIIRGCAACAPRERLLACSRRLDRHIQALHELCGQLYCTNNRDLCDAACKSIQSFSTDITDTTDTSVTSDNTDSDLSTQLTFQRALLLMAMHLEPEVAHHFHVYGNEATRQGVLRLKASILPKTVRTFITGLCQSPQTFCNQTLLLYELWDEQGHMNIFADEEVVTPSSTLETEELNGEQLFPSLKMIDSSLQMGEMGEMGDPLDVMDVRDIVAPSDEDE